MKNFLLFACLLFPVLTFSQQQYGKGVVNISGGVGFPNTTHAAIDASNQLFSLNGDDAGSSTPFFNLSGTYGVSENVDAGIYLGYFNSDSEIIATGTTLISALNLLGANINLGEGFGNTKYSVFTVGGRLIVHQPIFDNEKLDTYASTFLGYNFVQDDFDSVEYVAADDAEFDVPIIGVVNINDLIGTLLSNANYPTITYEVNAGAKYALGEQMSIFGEAGYGRFLINAGFTYTFD